MGSTYKFHTVNKETWEIDIFRYLGHQAFTGWKP